MSLISVLRTAMLLQIIFSVVLVQAMTVASSKSSMITNQTATRPFDGKDRSQHLDNRRQHIDLYHSGRGDLLERIVETVDDITLRLRLQDHDRQLGRLAQLQQQDALLQKQAIDDATSESFRSRITEEVERIWRMELNHSSELIRDQQLDESRYSTLIQWINETQRQVERELLLSMSANSASTDRLMRGLDELKVLLKQGEDSLVTINSNLIDEIRRPQTKDESASSARRIILERVDKLRELMDNISVEQTQQREVVQKDHRELKTEMTEMNGSLSRLREVVQRQTRQEQLIVGLNDSLNVLHVDSRQIQSEVEQIETRLYDRLQRLQMTFSREIDERQRRLEDLSKRVSQRVAAEGK